MLRLTSFAQKAVSQDIAVAWAVVAVLGAVSISVSHNAQGQGRHFWPLVWMFAYLAFALTRPSRNTTRVADSVYFLGFLWTLYALIDNLIWRPSEDLGVKQILRIFGYALVTTAAGMFLRLL